MVYNFVLCFKMTFILGLNSLQFAEMLRDHKLNFDPKAN